MADPKSPREATASPPEKPWFFRQDERIHGPLPARELRELAVAGVLLPEALIWQEGTSPNDGFPADAALDFPALRASAPAVPDWLSDIVEEPAGPRAVPEEPGISPLDWLGDVAALEATRPAPTPEALDAGGVPDWLAEAAAQAEIKRSLTRAEAENTASAPLAEGQKVVIGVDLAAVRAEATPQPAVPRPVLHPHQPLAKPATPVHQPAVPAKPTARLAPAVPRDLPVATPVPAVPARSAPIPDFRGLTMVEVYRAATRTIDAWVDEDGRRDLLKTVDPPAIHQQARQELQLDRLQVFGGDVMRKLLGHLALMIDNRRKYYLAIADKGER